MKRLDLLRHLEQYGCEQLNRVDLLRDVFLWAYGRSTQRYGIVRQSVAEHDPFRLRYRREIADVLVEMIDRGSPPGKSTFRGIAADRVAGADLEPFVELAFGELLDLHEGNIARYRIRPHRHHEDRLMRYDAPHVVDVEPHDDYTLTPTFENGERRLFDMKPHLDAPVFRPLRDLDVFYRVKVVYGSLEWPDERDNQMKTYDFDLVLSAPTTEEEDELVFEHFEGRVSPSVTAGVGCLSVHFEAESMEEAIQDAIRRAEEVGLTVERVELEKKAFEVA